jgi:hypothetical protein
MSPLSTAKSNVCSPNAVITCCARATHWRLSDAVASRDASRRLTLSPSVNQCITPTARLRTVGATGNCVPITHTADIDANARTTRVLNPSMMVSFMYFVDVALSPAMMNVVPMARSFTTGPFATTLVRTTTLLRVRRAKTTRSLVSSAALEQLSPSVRRRRRSQQSRRRHHHHRPRAHCQRPHTPRARRFVPAPRLKWRFAVLTDRAAQLQEPRQIACASRLSRFESV